MFHLVAHSVDDVLLFRNWSEARRLWDVVLGATPGRIAVALMPNHIHVLHPLDVHEPLAAALSGFTRWFTTPPAARVACSGRCPRRGRSPTGRSSERTSNTST